VPLIHGCWLTAIVFSIGNAALLRVRILTEEAAMGPRYALKFDGRPRLVPKLSPRPESREAAGSARRTTG
jgi:methyltransferase